MIRLAAAAFLTLALTFVSPSPQPASAEVLESAAAELFCGATGCPFTDPDVDCWYDGTWYYNHCYTECI